MNKKDQDQLAKLYLESVVSDSVPMPDAEYDINLDDEFDDTPPKPQFPEEFVEIVKPLLDHLESLDSHMDRYENDINDSYADELREEYYSLLHKLNQIQREFGVKSDDWRRLYRDIELY